jgi:hypothetical protein
MVGTGCAYDFLKLMSCANILYHLVVIEHGENGLQFGQVHNKIEKEWVNLHPLQEGESITNLVYNI